MVSATINTDTLAYKELETKFKEQYHQEKASQKPHQQEEMAVDGTAAPRKADNLEEVEAKRQRQAAEEEGAGSATP